MKQWEMERNSKVILSDQSEITFLGMDGIYGKWLNQEGGFVIANFDGEFEKIDDKVYKQIFYESNN